MSKKVLQHYEEWKGDIKRSVDESETYMRQHAFDGGYQRGYTSGIRAGFFLGVCTTIILGALVYASPFIQNERSKLEKVLQTPAPAVQAPDSLSKNKRTQESSFKLFD